MHDLAANSRLALPLVGEGGEGGERGKSPVATSTNDVFLYAGALLVTPTPTPPHKGEGIMTCLAPPAIENRTNDAISGAKPQKRGKT